MTIELLETDEFNRGTKIKVIGIGGGGGNAVEHMIRSSVSGVEFICANTDAQALGNSSALKTIQLGTTGLGAGSKPEKGKDAAEFAEQEIRAALEGSQMLFLTAGMGGGTGTGAAPIIAKIAKEMGILTVAVVTKPFDFEGTRRMKNAELGLGELEENVDSLIVVLNEKLMEIMGDDISQDAAFSQANDVLRNAVGGISEIINVPGLVNVDFEDVSTVMSEKGRAMMGTACASGPERARIAAEAAVQCPLLEGIEISGAKGVLVLVSASKSSLKLSESKLAMNTICNYASPDANIIYGSAYDETLGDEIRVTVIATGLSRHTHSQNKPMLQAVRSTGTDHAMPTHLMGSMLQGNTGTRAVGIGAIASAEGSSRVGSTSISGGNKPQVWRTNHAPATSRVEALSNSGMDDYEIPAYLRKQAD